MKIIDFEKKGNVVRFYLGNDDCNDYWGDDWNDIPYEHNAGSVYSEFVSTIKDVAFPFDSLVLEPCEDWCYDRNSPYSKQDMKARRVPCIIVVPKELVSYSENFNYYVGMDGITRYYFGDEMEV